MLKSELSSYIICEVKQWAAFNVMCAFYKLQEKHTHTERNRVTASVCARVCVREKDGAMLKHIIARCMEEHSE